VAIKGTKSRQAGSARAAKKTVASHSWTPSRVIAHNVEAARKRLGWTQLGTVEQFARYGLTSWGRTGYAMAVVAVSRGARTREFGADELLIFAQALGTTVAMLFMPPFDVTVAVSGGGPTLDINAIRKLAYPTEPPPLRNKREAELEAQKQKDIFNFLFQKMGIEPGILARILSPGEITESADEVAAVIEHTLRRGKSTRKKDR
jgi:hypothetical protein